MICLFREPGRKVNCVSNTILTHKSRFHFLCFDSTVFCRFFLLHRRHCQKKKNFERLINVIFCLREIKAGNLEQLAYSGKKDSLSIAHGH